VRLIALVLCGMIFSFNNSMYFMLATGVYILLKVNFYVGRVAQLV
jgi:hypothetical protein